jgi:hypothetical protein
MRRKTAWEGALREKGVVETRIGLIATFLYEKRANEGLGRMRGSKTEQKGSCPSFCERAHQPTSGGGRRRTSGGSRGRGQDTRLGRRRSGANGTRQCPRRCRCRRQVGAIRRMMQCGGCCISRGPVTVWMDKESRRIQGASDRRGVILEHFISATVYCVGK